MASALDDRVPHIERLVDAIDLPIGRWDSGARLLFCNEPYTAWAGRSREQLLGHTLEDLYGPPAWAAAKPAFEAAFCGRTVTYQRQLQHGRFDGRWARMQVFPDSAPDGSVEAVFTIAFDIHDDVLAQEALRAARQRLDRFAENIPYPLTYVDRDFTLRFVNKAYMEATRETAENLIGRHIGMVRGAKRWSEHRPYFERAMQGKTLPGVVSQVVAAASSPRTSAGDLAKLISQDPMLAARVIRAANSAAFKSAGAPCASVPEAVRKIGTSTVRNLAAAMGIFQALPAAGPDGFSPIRCWQHSLATALLAEHLVSAKHPELAGLAYIIGLCHDLGEIIFRTQFGNEYRKIADVQKRTGKPIAEVEQQMVGATSCDVVMTILTSLGLPPQILEPIEIFHGAPADGKEGAQLAQVLRLADAYATGVLLAPSPGSQVFPILKTDCTAAVGVENPSRLDSLELRGQILSLCAMLMRFGPAEEAEATAPLIEKRARRIWLAVDPALSTFDPLVAALDLIGDVAPHPNLPRAPELAEYDGLCVVAASTDTENFRQVDIVRAIGQDGGARTLPVLWLVGKTAGGVFNPNLPMPRTYPVTLEQLSQFVNSCAGSARPTAAAA